MQYRQLGQGGDQIPVLMFGAWPIGGGMGAVDEATAQAAILRSIDVGVNAIDTAEWYRESEGVIGRALVGRPRDSVYLATKVSFGPYTRQRIRDALENSLRALRTDYVDLYQLHTWPHDVEIEEAMEGLLEAQRSGKVRSIGVSNFSVENLEAARAVTPYHSLQPAFSIFEPSAANDLIPYCEQHGIGVIAHSPLAKGLLTGSYRPGHRFPADDERHNMPRFQGERFVRSIAAADQIAEVAREKGLTLLQLAIAWTLAHPGVTSCIVGAKTAAQVDDWLPAADANLTVDDVARINAIAAPALGR